MSGVDFVAAQSDAVEPIGFQGEIIENMTAALLRYPSPPCLLRSPTGSGKTFMLAKVLSKVSAQRETVWLWFVPFVNLVQQTEDALLANADSELVPVMLSRGRNQEPKSGMVLLSTAQGVAKAADRNAGYSRDSDDDQRALNEFVELARARGLNVGLVVDEAHIGLDKGTEFGKFAHWLKPEFLVMASATPKDDRLDQFLAQSGKNAREAFVVSRARVVEARLNKRYVEAVVYDLRKSISTITDLKRTVLRQAWMKHLWLKQDLQARGINLMPLLLVQVANGDDTVEEARDELIRLCKVPAGAIGMHSADAPDPVLMAAIANDHSKEVLIFKQSAGTGFDAPRAFVLASTKTVNDADFAMQFIGRVMRVAPAIRTSFPKPTPIPADLDTAYIYLADADAQQGFQSAVNTSLAVKGQLEGQTENMVERQTKSGATVFTNRVSPQLPVTYDGVPPAEADESAEPEGAPAGQSDGQQGGLFTDLPGAGTDTGSTLMTWDPVVTSTGAPAKPKLPKDEEALIDLLADQGLKPYRRNLKLSIAPAALQRETAPILDDMARVSKQAATALPLPAVVVERAVQATYNLLQEKEIHTELTEGHSNREEAVAVITDRGALVREAMASLRRIPQIEDQDIRIIVSTLAGRLRPEVAKAPEGVDVGSLDDKQLNRLSRDAACWVIRRESHAFFELVQETVASFATVGEAAPLPDVMLYPLKHALKPSRRGLYGVVPPLEGNLEAQRDGLDIDAMTSMGAHTLAYEGGTLRVAGYDGASAVNLEESAFIDAVDSDDRVLWWHRNPVGKPWSLRLVRSEHTHYFYPDFVVCLEYPDGKPPMIRMVETKHDTKDAADKARRTPKIYGKVLFLTKAKDRLRVVNDDGSLGETLDWENLEPAWKWMAERP